MVNYVTGDATKPIGDGNKIIAHICNDSGRWGAGFVLSLNKLSPEPKKHYVDRWMWTEDPFLPLGVNQYVFLPNQIIVANMVAQHGTISNLNPHPLSYNALENCLSELVDQAKSLRASVHMPRIGSGLAGGKWNVVESIIDRVLTLNDIEVTVYDLP